AEANPFAMFVTNDWSNIERLGPFAVGFCVPEVGHPATAGAMGGTTTPLVRPNHWSNTQPRGPFALGFWVPEVDNPAMWGAIVDGTIDVVGSDHGAHTREEKELGWTDMYAAPGGSPFIEHYLRMILKHGHSRAGTAEGVRG